MEKEIIWTQTTLNQLENIYFYLLEETKSFEIANKVVDGITDAVEILKTNLKFMKLMSCEFRLTKIIVLLKNLVIEYPIKSQMIQST